jgi:voltage-gated potassium channel
VSVRTLGVQLIFNPETKRFNKRLRNVISILRNPAQRVNLKKSQDYQNLKKYIHRIIFETDTLEGILFDIGLFILIILSVIIVMLGSINDIQPRWGQTLRVLDWIITLMFTIEYALRIWTTKQPRKYIFSFFGMVDLLSILPLYLEIMFSGLYSLEIIRIIRLVRIFRVLKLIRFMSEADLILRSLRSSANKIFVFLFFVLIVCTILGSVMFLVEGPESGFINIPQGIYWAVVTLTTVGYGDIYPVTGMGKFIAMVLMIMGYGVIAVPTGLVAAGVMSEAIMKIREKKTDIKTALCPNCNSPVLQQNAAYCNVCGTKLYQNTAGTNEPGDP